MAYRQAPSPRSLSNTMYVPENDPNRAAAQQEVIDAYNAQFGAKAQWDRNYQFVLQNTGDPEKARIYADSIASTQNRQELTQLATGVAGPAASFGREAIATARALRGAAAAEEAPGAMRLLAGPSRRNAQTAEEMLTPDVIPMGGPSFNTPRLTYAKPETRYRMALDRTAQPRPLANYENPVRDQMYVAPEEMRPFSAGEVRTPVDPIAALNTETTVPVSNAPKWADVRLKEAQRAEEMMNEGGVWPTQQRTLRRLAGESEDAFRARQLAIMEEEGGGAGRQATLNNLDRQAEADFRARQMGALDDESGAITSGRNPPNPVARALQVVEREAPAAAAPGPGTGFTMIDTPGQGFTMTPPSRAMTMRTVGSEAAGTQAPASTWYGEPPSWQRAGYRNSNVDAAMEDIFNATHGRQGATVSDPLIAATPGANRSIPWGAVLGVPAASMATVYGATKLIDQINGPRQAAGQPQAPMPIDPEIKTRNGRPVYFTGPAYDINSKDMYDYTLGATPAEVLGSRRATASAIDSAYAPVVASPAPATASQQAVQQAVQQARTQTAPMPPTRPAELAREQPGILSKIFGQPATTRQLFEQSQADPSDSGAWMRAERQYAKTHKDEPNFDVTKLNEQGMKRGGVAGKPDSVHKALEIIHHLLTRGH